MAKPWNSRAIPGEERSKESLDPRRIIPQVRYPASMDLEICENNEVFVWENNDLEFHHTKLILKSGNDQYSYATTRDRQVPNHKVDVNKLELIPIPAHDIWPPFDPSFTRAPEPLSDFHYVKEWTACEILKKHPHPNVATYFGCVVKDGRVRGLCFVKYPRTLAQRMKMPEPFDVRSCQQGIREGVHHMHECGLIHNDLNPANIMIDDANKPIIIDFDSCKPEGEELGIKAGTHGWTADDSKFAVRENDFYALEKIDAFLMQAGSRNECHRPKK
ncbi:kinase-like domain-containing protein [Xylaria digitata]|nr:kinase-like domain-containing protein [Xylaria digitata]